MKKYEYIYKGFHMQRIDKKTARKAYNNGLTVVLCPVNLRPGPPWSPEMKANKNNMYGCDFEPVVNSFEFYNCINSETGKYTAFYIPVVYIDGFNSDLLGDCKQYDYRFMEA